MTDKVPDANPLTTSPDDLTLARTAKDWLTFERLRQELLNLGASDPLLVSATSRDVERVVLLILSPSRAEEDVEKTCYALIRALSGHPDIAKLRFQADVDVTGTSHHSLQAMLLRPLTTEHFHDGSKSRFLGAAVCI